MATAEEAAIKRQQDADELEKLIRKANKEEVVPVWDLIMEKRPLSQLGEKSAAVASKLVSGESSLSEFTRSRFANKPAIESNESDHLHWKREDFFGRFQARHISAYVPIPGQVIEDWNQRKEKRETQRNEMMAVREAEAAERSEHAKHRRYMRAHIMPYTTEGRNITRLLKEVDEASRDLIKGHNTAYTTDARHTLAPHEIPDIKFKDISLNDFKHNTISKKHLEELEDRLWKMYQPPKPEDVVSMDVVSGTKLKPYEGEWKHSVRLAGKYGGQFRKKTLARQKQKKDEKRLLAGAASWLKGGSSSKKLSASPSGSRHGSFRLNKPYATPKPSFRK